MNYYNEYDTKAAAWIRELIAGGHIPNGFVDERSITDIHARDLEGFDQCHFFAGIGGWPLALKLAGWPSDRPVWTGSCPCQPFSVAGKGRGKADPRHLWPHFRRLIRQCRPPVVFGEQVASAAGRVWLSGVCSDLEAVGYCTAGADLCAAGGPEDCEIGIVCGDSPLEWERATLSAPHIRQRLFWVAGRMALTGPQSARRQQGDRELEPCGESCRDRLEHPESHGRLERRSESGGRGAECGCGACNGRVGDTIQPGLEGHPRYEHNGHESRRIYSDSPRPASTPSSTGWSNFDLVPCRDGKARRIESGTFPLAHGVPGRVGLLRGYGNAIVPGRAADFIQAAAEALEEQFGHNL